MIKHPGTHPHQEYIIYILHILPHPFERKEGHDYMYNTQVPKKKDNANVHTKEKWNNLRDPHAPIRPGNKSYLAVFPVSKAANTLDQMP